MVLSFQLAKALVFATNFYHRTSVDAEVALLIACIFHGVASRGQLVGKICLADSAYLWLLWTKCIEQIGIVKINLIWLLKVCDTL